MSYALLWLLGLTVFGVSFALKRLWLSKHKPDEKGAISFELFAGISLILAGIGLFKATEPFLPLGLNFLLAIIFTILPGFILQPIGERVSRHLTPFEGFAEFLVLILKPLVIPCIKLRGTFGPEERGSEKIVVLEGEKHEIVEGALDLEETIVREIMVPRIDLVAVKAEATVAEAIKIAIESGHSRFPAYEESLDNIVGVIHVKELLRKAWEGKWDDPVKTILRPPYFVPETKNAAELLREMQRQRIHMAIVVDEYGGTAGIITLEDLLEEIFGEIQDEYDREEPLIREVGEGEYILDGRLSLEELEEIIGKELDLEGIDTLGGLVYSRFGKVPERGAHFQLEGFDFEVLSLVGRRIGKIRLRKITGEREEYAGRKSEAVEQNG